MDASLDALVRRVDEDRWLASRFAEAPARRRLIGLYAAVYEIARTVEAVREEMLGAIRLQWWRDAVTAIFEGGAAPDHPAVTALAEVVHEAQLPRATLDALIDARAADFETLPFDGWADLEAYVDATAGGVVRLAAQACMPSFAPTDEQANALRAAGRAWGYVGLVRAAPLWMMRKRTFLPRRLLAHVGLDPATLFTSRTGHAYGAALRAVLDRGIGALVEARQESAVVPATVFPAISYVALASGYVKSLTRASPAAATGARPPAMLLRQLRLVGATAVGAL